MAMASRLPTAIKDSLGTPNSGSTMVIPDIVYSEKDSPGPNAKWYYYSSAEVIE